MITACIVISFIHGMAFIYTATQNDGRKSSDFARFFTGMIGGMIVTASVIALRNLYGIGS